VSSATADATIRFCNGREIVVREYWYAGGRLMFSRPGGAVGVPRAFATVVAAPNAAKIEARSRGVNARGGLQPTARGCLQPTPRGRLSAQGRSVTLGRAMPSKDELYDRAVDLVADGKLDDAIATYREAIALDPAFVDALQGLALAYADKGMFDEAIEVGHKLAALSPDDPLAHTSLSMFYQRKGMIPEAEAEGAKARMLDWKRQLAEQKKEGGGS
jgi:tetratricopeptide (TPR) repeat protein